MVPLASSTVRSIVSRQLGKCLRLRNNGLVGAKPHARAEVAAAEYRATNVTGVRWSMSQAFSGQRRSLLTTAAQRQLILAVDTSKDSEYAIDWTVANMYRSGDKIHIVHCIPGQPMHVGSITNGLGISTMPEESPPPTVLTEQKSDSARQMLTELYSERLSNAKVDYAFDVLFEEGAALGQGVGDKLVGMANELDATAVVVSAHRKSMLAEFMMGSISNFLVHQCDKPVIVLHAPRNTESAQHLQPSDARNIVIAVDETSRSEQMVSWTLANVVRPGDHVHVLHVIPALPVSPNPPLFAEGLVVLQPSPVDEDKAEVEREVHDGLEQRLTALLPADGSVGMTVHVITEDSSNPLESVGSAICNKAQELGAAALVSMSGHKGVFEELIMGSVTGYLAHRSETPLLVLEPQVEAPSSA